MPEEHHHDEDDGLEQIAKAIRESGDDVAAALLAVAEAILALVPKAVIAHLSYSITGGSMGNPVNGAPGNTATPMFTEAAADGSSVAPIGPVLFASDNPAIVSVDSNTGIATLVAAGTETVSALDQGNGLTDSVLFTVTAVVPVAVSASLQYTLNPSRRR